MRALSPDRTTWAHVARWPALAALACAIAGAQGPHEALTALAILASSLVGSIGGFAFGPICGIALLPLVPDPVRLVQIIVLCSIANQGAMVWSLRRDIPWRTVAVFLAGGAPGVPIGIWLLLHADRRSYSQALGAVLLVYCSYRLFVPPRPWRPASRAIDAASGFLGGIIGGATSFVSAPVVVRCGLKDVPALRQRAIYQPFVLVMQVFTLALVGVLQQTSGTPGLAAQDVLLVPASVVGSQAGMALFRRLSSAQFSRAITILLLVSAVGLLWA